MKKTFILLQFTLQFFYAGAQNDSSLFRLGIPIDSLQGCIFKEEITIVIGSGMIKEGVRCEINGMIFDVAYLKDRRVVYYSTRDSNFLINNFRYLTKNKAIVDSLKKETIVFDPNSGAYINLPQGWKLGFLIQDISTGKNKMSLKKNAIPQYLFKRNISTDNSGRNKVNIGGTKTRTTNYD